MISEADKTNRFKRFSASITFHDATDKLITGQVNVWLRGTPFTLVEWGHARVVQVFDARECLGFSSDVFNGRFAGAASFNGISIGGAVEVRVFPKDGESRFTAAAKMFAEIPAAALGTWDFYFFEVSIPEDPFHAEIGARLGDFERNRKGVFVYTDFPFGSYGIFYSPLDVANANNYQLMR
jgi:hypothetical protein